MKTKYIFLSALILVAVAYASAERTEYPTSRRELVNIIREQDEKIEGIASLQNEITKLRFERDIYRKALTDANVPLPDLAKIAKEYVFRSSIQERFKKPLSVGQVAYLKNDKPQVQQILDERNMLVLLQKKVLSNPVNPRGEAFVHKKGVAVPGIDYQPTEMPGVYTLVADVTVWITGISTAGLADDTDFVTDKPFVIKGTRKDSSGNTVFVLEPVKVFPD